MNTLLRYAALLTCSVSLLSAGWVGSAQAADKEAVKVLIITGDHGHN